MRQKQVDEAIARAMARRPPTGKLRCILTNQNILELRIQRCPEHLLLRFDIDRKVCLFDSCPVSPTDKRILDAALAALNDPNGLPAPQPQKKRKLADGTTSGRPSKASVSAAAPENSAGSRSTFKTVVGEEVEEKSSRFLAIVAFPVADRREANAALSQLLRRNEFAGATHRISAYICENGEHDCDDDGEDRAGASLRSALRKEGVRGAVAVVARWYGGVNIGKARFRHIQERAVLALQAAGHVAGQPMREAYWSSVGIGRRLGDDPPPDGRLKFPPPPQRRGQTTAVGGQTAEARLLAAKGEDCTMNKPGAREVFQRRLERQEAAALKQRASVLKQEAPYIVAHQPTIPSANCLAGETGGASSTVVLADTPTKWACSQCTFLNVPTDEACDICGAERSLGAHPVPSSSLQQTTSTASEGKGVIVLLDSDSDS